MTVSPLKTYRARANGILIPIRAALAAEKAGISYAVACALLEQESGGGQNIYGHDPGNYCGAGAVTKANYADYKAKRQAGAGMQGVGPAQLTWWEFQDQADAIGGAYRPYPNMVVGFGIIAGYLKAGKTLHEAFAAYNGSETYAVQMDARVAKWRGILN